MDMVTNDRMVTTPTGRGGTRACGLVAHALATLFALATGAATATPALAHTAADVGRWLSDELPLPLPVKTPQDIGFKSAVERQYLIFNLMAGGKLAYQRGDYAT